MQVVAAAEPGKAPSAGKFLQRHQRLGENQRVTARRIAHQRPEAYRRRVRGDQRQTHHHLPVGGEVAVGDADDVEAGALCRRGKRPDVSDIVGYPAHAELHSLLSSASSRSASTSSSATRRAPRQSARVRIAIPPGPSAGACDAVTCGAEHEGRILATF